MKGSRIAVALVAVAFSIGSAQAITVHRSVTVKGSPWWVWWEIGGFCKIEDWLPPVKSCHDWWEKGAKYRKLTLKDGSTVTEKLTAKTRDSYDYDIIDSPLPVANYHATFKVMAAPGGGTLVDWRAHFQAHNATKAEAASVIAGIFEAGLNRIAADRGK